MRSVQDVSAEAVQFCMNRREKDQEMSYCLNEAEAILCPNSSVFRCPEDMVCSRRGRRAYCVPPGMKLIVYK